MSFALAALVLLADAPWPLTTAELEGKAWVYNARVDDSSPCSVKTKTPVELRLFARTKSGPQLRLTVKNCGLKPVKLLHDTQLQPSRLEFSTKVKAPFDERSREKYDATVRTRSFITLAAGEERVLADETLQREGEDYGVSWGPFRYAGLPLGKQKLRVAHDAYIDTAFDEEEGKKVPVAGAAVGAFKSNEVTLTLP